MLKLPGLAYLNETRRYHGTRSAVLGLGYRLLRLGIEIRVCYLIGTDIVDVADADDLPTNLGFRFLAADEIREFAADPVNDLDANFAVRVAEGRDLCFAAFDGDRLVNYSWYALDAIEAEHSLGFAMSFPSDTAYLYKAFTHPDYRGRRVHHLATLRAFDELPSLGVRRVVGIMEYGNWPSLRSHVRLGGKLLARITTIGSGPKRIECIPRHLEDLGLRLGRRADLSRRARLSRVVCDAL
ncbi:MAG TPA: hypothetical protein VHV77_15840 [Pirellulales bacterium]|nr:hypothetical protein [Pirellulales bacterium]